MKDKRIADQVSQVQDKPAEVWIKLLSFITGIAVLLVAYMGDRVIKGQDKMAAGQVEMTKEISKLNSYFKVIDGRVSRNETDIKEVRSLSTNNLKRIYKLEGNK